MVSRQVHTDVKQNNTLECPTTQITDIENKEQYCALSNQTIQELIAAYDKADIAFHEHSEIFYNKEKTEIKAGRRLKKSHPVYEKHNHLTGKLVAILHAILACPVNSIEDLLAKLEWLKCDDRRTNFCLVDEELLELIQSFDPLLKGENA